MSPAPHPPQVGRPEPVAADLLRILAPNPSPMTHWGTNTYLLGDRTRVLIDPGPDNDDHLAAIINALGDASLSHILVTHTHLDHSPLARRLAAMTGASVLAFGDAKAGRSEIMQEIGNAVGGGEGIDHDFAPDTIMPDNASLDGAWGSIRALHTPGHIGNHLCFAWRDHLFSGDHVMGWASSLVSPPDGDLNDFLASCAKLQRVASASYWPGHGDRITDPQARLTWLVNHRNARSAAIIDRLDAGPATAAELTASIYHDTPQALWPAARRNVLAHLIALSEQGQIAPEGDLHADAVFHRIGRSA